ncbi:unnamed protein product [Penicillium palitans]
MVDRASDSPTTSKPRQAKRTKISKPAPAIVDLDSDVPAPKPTRAKTMRANKPDAKTIIEGVEKRVAAMAKLMTNEHDARRERGLDCRPSWQPGDPAPPQTDRRHSPNRACAPLPTVVEWDEDGKWVPPPTGVRLSDELAYIATKTDMSNKTLKRTYPFDFDGNASRTPEDPAPLIRAHGLPFIAVARDTVALSGRKHAFLCAALLDKNDKNIKSARSAFTIGTIVATKTFVYMPRTIDRQLFTHSGMYPESRNEEATRAEANFPKEFRPVGNARDTMSSLHNALATLMGKPVTVIRLIDLPAYRLTCGPGNDSTTIGESFVNKFATQPYSNLLALDYVNADDVQAPITQQVDTAATPEKKKTRRSRKHEQTT